MYRFLIVIEKADEKYSAYSPDLSSYVATGSTCGETEQNVYETIMLHVKGLVEDGAPIPLPQAFSRYLVIR